MENKQKINTNHQRSVLLIYRTFKSTEEILCKGKCQVRIFFTPERVTSEMFDINPTLGYSSHLTSCMHCLSCNQIIILLFMHLGDTLYRRETEKMPPGQNALGQNASWTKCPHTGTKCPLPCRGGSRICERGGGPWRARGARAYNGGLGRSPQWGPGTEPSPP